ncbi:MAG: ATP-binding cassette domain-containing protein [Pseudomonadota bacterium]
MSNAPPLLQLKDVSLTYGLRRILRAVSFEVRAGEVVGLVGPGGCGKTQLIKILATLLIPFRGEVHHAGVRIRRGAGGRTREARRHIGMQFQNFALFDSLTVADNVAYPLLAHRRKHGHEARTEALDRAEDLLARVGLEGTGELLPAALSGGMKRRVAVARALVARPRLALFDDPTAGLDPVNSARILELVAREATGEDRALVVASHDLDRLLPLVNRVLVLRDGALVFDGTPGEGLAAENPWVRAFIAQEGTHGAAR